jgi:hypothetical protein
MSYRPPEPVFRVKNSRPTEPAPTIPDLLTALIERIDAAELAAQAREQAAIARHAELMKRLATTEDAAICADLTASETLRELWYATGTYDPPVDED